MNMMGIQTKRKAYFTDRKNNNNYNQTMMMIMMTAHKNALDINHSDIYLLLAILSVSFFFRAVEMTAGSR